MLAEYSIGSQITLTKPIADKLGLVMGDKLNITEKDGGVLIMPVLQRSKDMEEAQKRKLLNNLFGSIDDPTFVEPPEIPLKYNAPREEII